MNRVTFTVKCRLYDWKQDKFTFDYTKVNDSWFPVLTGSCDECTNCEDCQQCISEAVTKAKQLEPPFLP